MSLEFEIAGGSVQGRTHRMAGRGSQDAYSWTRTDRGLVAVVCDGCGSSPHSAVGSKVGSRLIVQSASMLLEQSLDPAALLGRVRDDVIAHLRPLVKAMSVERTDPRGVGPAMNFAATVIDYFLFTVVGVLITDRDVTTFSLGDGLIVVNGDHHKLGPFPNNAPPYLGYDLVESHGAARAFTIHTSLPTSAVDSVLLATDGVFDLEAAAAAEIQGRGEPIGPLAQFWQDDKFFRNSDMIRRGLAIASRFSQPSVLPDDTTIVAIRRRTGAAS